MKTHHHYVLTFLPFPMPLSRKQVKTPKREKLPANETVAFCRKKTLLFWLVGIGFVEAVFDWSINNTGIHVTNEQVEEKTSYAVDEEYIGHLSEQEKGQDKEKIHTMNEVFPSS